MIMNTKSLKPAFFTVLFAAAFAFSSASSVLAGPVKVSLEKTGIEIDAGGKDKVTIQYPILGAIGNDGSEKAEFKVSGRKAEAKYPSGATMEIELSGSDELTCKFSKVPDFMTCFKFSTVLPSDSYAGKAKFQVGGAPLQEFPATPGKEQFLIKGTKAGEFNLETPNHGAFTLIMATNWFEMQDNRAMGWGNQFIYSFFYDTKAYPGATEFKIQIKPFKASANSQ